MIGNSKPLASLSSGLLARKGQAKPAMRPQGYANFGAMGAAAIDDLGWNDMGYGQQMPAPVALAETPVEPVPPPPVLVQREELKEVIEAPVAPAPVAAEPRALRPVSVATATRIAKETRTKRGKAAFTLRLDGDRHLRLRLASAVSNRSAQLLVTEALDAFLDSLPEVDDLARQIPARAKR
jgi:hypothetical protein